MSINFELFRLSLIEKPQKPLFSRKEREREVYLRAIFSERYEFTHRKKRFYYIPEETHTQKKLIIGRIGCEAKVEENLPPDEGLIETERPSWKASIMVIDPVASSDGQKVAFQKDNQVGSPYALLENFVTMLNERNQDSIFHLEVSPIQDSSDFWHFAEAHEGEITSITFNFIVPNMFGVKDAIEKELQQFRDEEKAQTVSVVMKSDEGINTNTPKIRESVDYTSRGGGTLRARTRSGLKYNSEDKKLIKAVDIINSDISLLQNVRSQVNVLFGDNDNKDDE